MLQKIPPADTSNQSTSKRHADAVDSPETSAVKKPKLEPAEQSTAPEAAQLEADTELADDVEDELPDESGPSKEPTPAPAASQIDPEAFKKQQRGKKHRADGSGVIHFKENPFTFVSPDDPIIKTCMFVLPSRHLSYADISLGRSSAYSRPSPRRTCSCGTPRATRCARST